MKKDQKPKRAMIFATVEEESNTTRLIRERKGSKPGNYRHYHIERNSKKQEQSENE